MLNWKLYIFNFLSREKQFGVCYFEFTRRLTVRSIFGKYEKYLRVKDIEKKNLGDFILKFSKIIIQVDTKFSFRKKRLNFSPIKCQKHPQLLLCSPLYASLKIIS